jgi:hypothetical protein
VDIIWQPKQRELLELLRATGPRVATIIGFGGAKGGGKSAGVDNIALTLATELGALLPGIPITIIRRVSKDLYENHIEPMQMRFPDLVPMWHSEQKQFVIRGKGSIKFAYAETEADVKRKFVGGYQSGIIFVDEAQQFSQKELQWISMAARWTDKTAGAGVPEGLCKTVFLFNPGGIGSDYLRRIFWLKRYEGEEKPHNFAFLHVFGWDNYEWFRGQVDLNEDDFYDIPGQCHGDELQSERCCRFHMFIRDTSEGRKMNRLPPSLRAGYLLGNFDHYEGQYFADVWDDQTCILTRAQVEQIIQPWWTRWMAQDWGFGDHDAHGWFAAGKLSPSQWEQHFGGQCEFPMDVVILYRENIISDRAEADLAQDLVNLTCGHAGCTREQERRSIQRFFMSQDGIGQRAKQQGAHTVGEAFGAILSRYGLPRPEPADQSRVAGWRFMFNCLRQANLRGQIVTEERSKEGVAFFVSTECPQTIESIPMAVRDDKDNEDVMRVDGVKWEDVTDMVRYGLKSMLDPKSKAPVEVRRKELYDSYEPGQETARAMAVLEFNQRERERRRTTRRGSFRGVSF